MNAVLGGRHWRVVTAVCAGLILVYGTALVVHMLVEALGLQE